MTLELEWTGQEAFVAEPLRDWTVGGKAAGLTRSAGAFTFATVHGAGHMVRCTLSIHFLSPLLRSVPARIMMLPCICILVYFRACVSIFACVLRTDRYHLDLMTRYRTINPRRALRW